MAKVQELPEALKPIAWLAGKWSTKSGRGFYPNIPEFAFHEDLEFKCIGQPMFNVSSISRNPERQTPMHLETGFLRVNPGTNQLAFAVSHNMGLTSLEEGTIDELNKEIILQSVNLARMSFAKKPYVKSIKRVIRLKGEELEVTMFMETDSTPMTEHLKSVYKRADE